MNLITELEAMQAVQGQLAALQSALYRGGFTLEDIATIEAQLTQLRKRQRIVEFTCTLVHPALIGKRSNS